MEGQSSGPWSPAEREEDRPSHRLELGDRVRLVHAGSGGDLKVEIRHAEPEEDLYGGVVLHSSVRPRIEPGDHVHFTSDQARPLQPDGTEGSN